MFSLSIRNLIFTVLHPGVVVGLIPYFILKQTNGFIKGNDVMQIIGSMIGFLGFIILLACIKRFAVEGRGTLSPFDATKRLVTNGLYRYTRNPMYVGVMGILIGEVLFFQSIWLGIYALGIFILFNLFIILHEEPRLRRDFEADYETYCRKVPRWF